MLKELIIKSITDSNNKKVDSKLKTTTLLNDIDDYGLNLIDFREDTNLEEWTENFLRESLELPVTSQAIGIMYILEEYGVSLISNGWISEEEDAAFLLISLYDIADCDKTVFEKVSNLTVH